MLAKVHKFLHNIIAVVVVGSVCDDMLGSHLASISSIYVILRGFLPNCFRQNR